MTETSDTSPEVTQLLAEDHREMLELVRQIDAASGDQERRDIADTAIAELMRHAVAEEMIVYPAMEKHLPDGKDEVAHDKEEHEELEQVMKRMEDADTSSSAFRDLVKELEEKLEHHIDDEEEDQFPKLRDHIPHDDLVEMGRKVEKAKKAAPTRPHPSAPNSELFHKTVGPGVGMVDRLRDKLTGRQG